MSVLARLSFAVLLATYFNPAFACPACEQKAGSQESTPVLSPLEVHSRLQRDQITVLDANPTDIFAKSHVPGAVRVEYDGVTPAVLPEDKTAPVVIYCMNERCGASPIAAKRARELGWTNVYLMPAGIQGWIAAGLPVEGTTASQ